MGQPIRQSERHVPQQAGAAQLQRSRVALVQAELCTLV